MLGVWSEAAEATFGVASAACFQFVEETAHSTSLEDVMLNLTLHDFLLEDLCHIVYFENLPRSCSSNFRAL